MTVGTGIAAIALHSDTRGAYLTVLYLDVATYALCTVLTATLPACGGRSREDALGMFHALRDVPFVALTLVSAVLSMHYWIIDLAMPLWVVNETDAPRRWSRCWSSSTPWSWSPGRSRSRGGWSRCAPPPGRRWPRGS